MPRALVTGITGQDGQYLAELLRAKGYDVFGLVTGQREKKVDELVENYPYVQPLSGDLRDLSSLISALEQSQPDEVYNLGAISFVALSFKQAELTAEVTGLGVLRMLEAVRIVGGAENNPIRFYQASSSEMFGKVRESPQNEETYFHPRSPYGAAKAFGHHITVNYRESYGLFACSGILFNHESVPDETPVVVRRNGMIDICPIGDLIPHPDSPEDATTVTWDGGGLEVWDGAGWTSCFARTAHWYGGQSFTVHGRGGVVTSTPEHVFLVSNGEMAARDLRAGDRVILARQPEATCATTLTHEEASLLGVLAAEGSILPDGLCRVTCHDEALLADASTWWERVSGGSSTKFAGATSAFSGRQTPTLRLKGHRAYLRSLRTELYMRNGQKRVPLRILNASPDLQESFLRAYNRGDGLRAGHGTDEFKSFRTTSPTLAAGLVWLAKTVLGREVAVYLQPGALGGGSSYQINLTSGKAHGKKGAHLKRPRDEVRRVDHQPFSGWMCDLATESGRFAAGVGFVVIHNSPLRGPEFLPRKISLAVARISLGLQQELAVGNLDSRRDWGFAGDYVEAMYMMLQQPEPDDYVVATGETHSGREFAELAFGHVGIEDWERYVRIDPRHFRPAEVDHLIGDASKARRVLGWEPKVDFPELVRLMVDADLKAEQDRL